ncbi:50S ribosomal protein L18 [Candidatus Parcubacteria bacterium]|nr:MAG: 50S ribosomal protein L18 [Candidatus Parcubacteria bacterium]
MKNIQKIKNQRRLRRKIRVRKKIFGTALRPRLSVFRSLNHVYIQFIDDEKGKTLLAVSDLAIKKKGNKKDRALEVGKLAGKKASEKGIKEAVLDRSCYKFHGRIKSIADGVREAGIKF